CGGARAPGSVALPNPHFFKPARRLTVGDIAALVEAVPRAKAELDRVICDIAALDRAGPADLVFFHDAAYRGELRTCAAGTCLVSEKLEAEVPERVAALRVHHPYRAFVAVAQVLFPQAMRP